ncbi:hypothetical protein KRM28CT15_24980 [Krasilnikovia sp. M28-CT-15]
MNVRLWSVHEAGPHSDDGQQIADAIDDIGKTKMADQALLADLTGGLAPARHRSRVCGNRRGRQASGGLVAMS